MKGEKRNMKTIELKDGRKVEIEDGEPRGVPQWAWYITWGIMVSTIIIEIIGIVELLKQ